MIKRLIGRPECMDGDTIHILRRYLNTRKTIIQISKEMNVSRCTIYRYINKYKIPYKYNKQQQTDKR